MAVKAITSHALIGILYLQTVIVNLMAERCHRPFRQITCSVITNDCGDQMFLVSPSFNNNIDHQIKKETRKENKTCTKSTRINLKGGAILLLI